jgi:hypothetical protein
MQEMMSGRRDTLSGRIEMDEPISGRAEWRKAGSRAAGKTPIVRRSRPRRKATGPPEAAPGEGFPPQAIAALAKRSFDPAILVVSDGLRALAGFSSPAARHRPIDTGSGRKASRTPRSPGWLLPIARFAIGAACLLARLGNTRSATSRAPSRHLTWPSLTSTAALLAEFAYRFNRRYDLAAMPPRLGHAQSVPPQCPIASSN